MVTTIFCVSRVFLLTLILGLSTTYSALSVADDLAKNELSTRLIEGSFREKGQALTDLIQSDADYVDALLEALLAGQLYSHKTEQTLAIQQEQGKTKSFIDPFSQAPLSKTKASDYDRIKTNNSLRKQIRLGIAQRNLSSADANIRRQAVDDLLINLDDEVAQLFQQQLATETDSYIQQTLQTGIALAALNRGSEDQQLAAIELVSGSLHPLARQRLSQLTDNPDPDIAKAAQQALDKIEAKIRWYGYLETLFFGLSLGSILALAAIGLAITFGVMGVINMAHGELIMLGAYTTFMVQKLLPNGVDYSLFIAIPAAFIVSGLVGILLERTIIRHLYGRPLETLLATFGVSLILQQFVRTFISPQNVPVSNPSWMSGSWEINSVLSLTLNRLYIIVFCLMVFAVLLYVMRKTNLGLQVRAVSQNRAMARAMGVRSAKVDALTFGLGAGIAGVAGVALSQITNVGPNLGQAYIIDSFMVVVFGGVGNLWGTLVAGLSLGVLNKVLEPWAGAVLAKILVLVFIILFIQKRPRGLFPQKGRAAGD